MKIEDMMKSMNPQKLSQMLSQMDGMLSPQQKQQIQQAFQKENLGQIQAQLGQVKPQDLKRELEKNPALAKQLASNPALMQKINQILKQ